MPRAALPIGPTRRRSSWEAPLPRRWGCCGRWPSDAQPANTWRATRCAACLPAAWRWGPPCCRDCPSGRPAMTARRREAQRRRCRRDHQRRPLCHRMRPAAHSARGRRRQRGTRPGGGHWRLAPSYAAPYTAFGLRAACRPAMWRRPSTWPPHRLAPSATSTRSWWRSWRPRLRVCRPRRPTAPMSRRRAPMLCSGGRRRWSSAGSPPSIAAAAPQAA
mmetsp:Transcript_55356/g.160383  ORF Transcript_55356/g.160383 Transcript_55356/m.160383 type:complete len:218 (+) Transcript_55356:94-747(+)